MVLSSIVYSVFEQIPGPVMLQQMLLLKKLVRTDLLLCERRQISAQAMHRDVGVADQQNIGNKDSSVYNPNGGVVY